MSTNKNLFLAFIYILKVLAVGLRCGWQKHLWQRLLSGALQVRQLAATVPSW